MDGTRALSEQAGEGKPEEGKGSLAIFGFWDFLYEGKKKRGNFIFSNFVHSNVEIK